MIKFIGIVLDILLIFWGIYGFLLLLRFILHHFFPEKYSDSFTIQNYLAGCKDFWVFILISVFGFIVCSLFDVVGNDFYKFMLIFFVVGSITDIFVFVVNLIRNKKR